MQPVTSNKNEILVVDDDFSIRELLNQTLEDEGYRVSTAENGLVALNYLRGRPELPCLIILDLKMPIMDGAEFRSRQMQDKRLANIPVLLLSADKNGQMEHLNSASGNFLSKPVKLSVLLEIIKRNGC
jgi:CheY-like chemotaxis protein